MSEALQEGEVARSGIVDVEQFIQILLRDVPYDERILRDRLDVTLDEARKAQKLGNKTLGFAYALLTRRSAGSLLFKVVDRNAASPGTGIYFYLISPDSMRQLNRTTGQMVDKRVPKISRFSSHQTDIKVSRLVDSLGTDSLGIDDSDGNALEGFLTAQCADARTAYLRGTTRSAIREELG